MVFKPQNGEKRFSNGYPTKWEKFFWSALGKRLFSSEKANKPFRELASCFVTNALNAKRPGRNAGL